MKRLAAIVLSVVIVAVFLLPVVYTVSHSFMDEYQLEQKRISLLPQMFNLQQYYKIVTEKSEYFRLYINSVIIVAAVIAGQLVISVGAAYWFAMSKKRLAKVVFLLYTFLMLLPLQITLIPNVLLYNGIERYIGFTLFDRHLAIILPGIFSTLGVFFLKQFFEAIPENIFEMAQIDGASGFKVMMGIVVPYSKNAILALCLINFIENWNITEQALIFLDTMSKLPVSVYMNTLYANARGIFYAGSVLYMFPVIYLFMKSKDRIRTMMQKRSEGGSNG